MRAIIFFSLKSRFGWFIFVSRFLTAAFFFFFGLFLLFFL